MVYATQLGMMINDYSKLTVHAFLMLMFIITHKIAEERFDTPTNLNMVLMSAIT